MDSGLLRQDKISRGYNSCLGEVLGPQRKDVTRFTETNLDHKAHKTSNDYWETDGVRDLNETLTGRTRFTLLKPLALPG